MKSITVLYALKKKRKEKIWRKRLSKKRWFPNKVLMSQIDQIGVGKIRKRTFDLKTLNCNLKQRTSWQPVFQLHLKIA